MSHSLVPSGSYSFLGVAAVVHRVNTCASVVYQLFAVYFVKVTHGVVTSANCAILLYKSACVYICVQDVYGIRYRPEVTSHSLETFSWLLARVPLELAIYQVESIGF